MRCSRQGRPKTKWTAAEYATVVRMRREGFLVREIADEIGRTFDAVASRLQQRNSIGYARRVKAKPASPQRPRVTIEKSQVPEFYEAGWRFSGFEGDKYVFEAGR